MNKAELVKEIVDKCGYEVTQSCVEDIVNTFMNVVKETVTSGDKVQLIGFGTFETSKRAERKGKNPQTGEEMIIPACTVPKFKPGKDFRQSVN